MTGSEYQKLAMRTCSIPPDDPDGRMHHAVFGLASEAGEVAGLFQKIYQGHELSRDHLFRELGDCLWMIAEICTAMGWTIDEVMWENIEKLKNRFPNGFDPEKSLHRKPGDV